jgi:hypothetical protein
MARDLTTALGNALLADRVQPIILAKINAASGDLRVWSGIGDLTYNAEVYTGAGTIGSVSEVEENMSLSASGVTFNLTGVTSEMLAIALAEIEHNRPATVWLGALDLSTGALIADPYQLFTGFTDVPTIEEGGETSTIALTAENKLIDLDRPRTRRYTTEDQQIDDATDVGFDFVPGLQDKSVTWGRN